MASRTLSQAARRAPSLGPLGVISLAAALTACATAPQTGPVARPATPGTTVTTRDGVTPPFMAGRTITRVGLLLPFSSRPQDAAALYNAAELALFDQGDANTLLIPRDAGGDRNAAAAAARALVNDGADIIIGPVTREGVEGAASIASASNIPVIGFSSDRSVAGNGTYLLSFQLEDEVARIVSFAAQQGLRSIALLAPSNEYGRRVEAALRAEAQRRGLTIPATQLYTRNDLEAASAARRLATALQTTPAQAVLIAESGSALRAIGPALVSGGLNPRQVRLLGTSVWGDEAEREPTFAGGWYVAPDPRARTNFEARYRNVYERDATRLSSLAYDAVSLAAFLSKEGGPNGFTRQAIQRSDGFGGSDGLFRFRADGSLERGLAIMEVRSGSANTLDPAPRVFSGPAG